MRVQRYNFFRILEIPVINKKYSVVCFSFSILKIEYQIKELRQAIKSRKQKKASVTDAFSFPTDTATVQ
jgi:hypothetical protein